MAPALTASQRALSADNSENTLRVLIATDNHLGFEERDSVRQHDSFLAFEEILRTARERYERHLASERASANGRPPPMAG